MTRYRYEVRTSEGRNARDEPIQAIRDLFIVNDCTTITFWHDEAHARWTEWRRIPVDPSYSFRLEGDVLIATEDGTELDRLTLPPSGVPHTYHLAYGPFTKRIRIWDTVPAMVTVLASTRVRPTNQPRWEFV